MTTLLRGRAGWIALVFVFSLGMSYAPVTERKHIRAARLLFSVRHTNKLAG